MAEPAGSSRAPLYSAAGSCHVKRWAGPIQKLLVAEEEKWEGRLFFPGGRQLDRCSRWSS